MDQKQQLILEIEACAKRLGVSPSTIGERAGQGGQFFSRLKGGKHRFWPETLEKVRAKVREFGEHGLPGVSICDPSHVEAAGDVQPGGASPRRNVRGAA